MLSARQTLSALFCVLLCSALALGQGSSGAISGTVTDPQAAVVAGATVTIKNLDTGLVHQVTSDASGYYRVPGLPSGRYEARAELPGFDTAVRTGLTRTFDPYDRRVGRASASTM